jgi:hypothetical protein
VIPDSAYAASILSMRIHEHFGSTWVKKTCCVADLQRDGGTCKSANLFSYAIFEKATDSGEERESKVAAGQRQS